jgi:hypothetical protein
MLSHQLLGRRPGIDAEHEVQRGLGGEAGDGGAADVFEVGGRDPQGRADAPVLGGELRGPDRLVLQRADRLVDGSLSRLPRHSSAR